MYASANQQLACYALLISYHLVIANGQPIYTALNASLPLCSMSDAQRLCPCPYTRTFARVHPTSTDVKPTVLPPGSWSRTIAQTIGSSLWLLPLCATENAKISLYSLVMWRCLPKHKSLRKGNTNFRDVCTSIDHLAHETYHDFRNWKHFLPND